MYSDIIIDHNNHPFNDGELANPDIESILENASCGDILRIQLAIKNGTIVAGKFTGTGCAISRAAADIILDEIVGKSKKEAKALLKNYRAMILGKKYSKEQIGNLVALQDIAKMPARTKCALLPYQIIDKF